MRDNYASVKKKEILVFATTRGNFKGIMLSEVSPIGKDKQCKISLICGTSKSQNNRVNW